MNKLENRIAKLEQAQPPERPLIIAVQFVAPKGQEYLKGEETGYPSIEDQIAVQTAAMKSRDKNGLLVFEPKIVTLGTLEEKGDV